VALPRPDAHAHQHATLERIQAHPLILANQDTSDLSFTGHAATDGLGPLAERGRSGPCQRDNRVRNWRSDRARKSDNTVCDSQPVLPCGW